MSYDPLKSFHFSKKGTETNLFIENHFPASTESRECNYFFQILHTMKEVFTMKITRIAAN